MADKIKRTDFYANNAYTPVLTWGNQSPVYDTLSARYVMLSEHVMMVSVRCNITDLNKPSSDGSLAVTIPDGYTISGVSASAYGMVWCGNVLSTDLVVRLLDNKIVITYRMGGSLSRDYIQTGYFGILAFVPVA